MTFSIEKEPPKTGDGASGNGDNVELFHGIGNTLGFNITGGSDFSMPITIFHVSMLLLPDGRLSTAVRPLLAVSSRVHVLITH